MDPQNTETKSASDSDATISNIGADLYDENRPTPSQHAIEAERAENESATITDKSGASFDPSQHASDSDGKPLYTVTGNFQKKRGRKAGNTPTKHVSRVGAPTQDKQDVAKVSNYRAIGQATAESIFMIGRVIGGDDWTPIKDEATGTDERAQMSDAWTQYAEAKQWKDIPPGVLVSIVMCGYIGPRLATPKTKTRVKVAWLWLKDKFARKKPPKEPVIED